VANEPVVDVLLLDLPAALWSRTRAHTKSVLRTDPPVGSALGELRDLVTAVGDRYGDVTKPAEAELSAAASRASTEPVDVAYPLPRSARDDVEALVAAWDKAEAELHEYGDPELVPPPEVTEFRRWFLGELLRQLDGGFPTPWRAGSHR
jgi:hypothetical protein